MSRHRGFTSMHQRQLGLSLIELMISLVLGLIVVGAAGAIFLSNKRVYGSTETLARIQENTRVAFELMARDVREAGGAPCKRDANVFRNFLNGGEENGWWQQWEQGMRGYEAGTVMPAPPNGRVPGTDAIDIHSAFGGGEVYVAEDSTPTSANLKVNTVTGFSEGDIAIVCDSQRTAMFQITGVNTGNISLQHNSGSSVSPGNCNMKFFFGDPPSRAMNRCNNGGTPVHAFPAGSRVVRVRSARWYIGTNARGGHSLYRSELTNHQQTAQPHVVGNPQEIAEGVSNLQLQYIVAGSGNYVDANATGLDWSQVSAVKIDLTIEGSLGALQGRDIQGVNGANLNRTISHIVSVRNHNP